MKEIDENDGKSEVENIKVSGIQSNELEIILPCKNYSLKISEEDDLDLIELKPVQKPFSLERKSGISNSLFYIILDFTMEVKYN